MIYPIVPYGEPILRKKAAALEPNIKLESLIQDMFATMDAARGVGLAAPQIGQSFQLFVMDISPFVENGVNERSKYRKVYINPTLEIIEPSTLLYYEEGCLSIPGIYVEVPRKKSVRIKFVDIYGQPHQEEWIDMPARVIQHEYDHLQGKLHIDYASAGKRLLMKKKLEDIKQGKVTVEYPMNFNQNKK